MIYYPPTATHVAGMWVLQEEMAAANIDMVNRDFCAHVLIKLNECRCVAVVDAALPALVSSNTWAHGPLKCCRVYRNLCSCRKCAAA